MKDLKLGILVLVQSFCSEVGKDADAKLVISFYNKQNRIQCNALSYLGLILLSVQIKVGIKFKLKFKDFLVCISAS